MQRGWTSWLVLVLFAAGAAALWTRWELRHEDPIVDLHLFSNRGVLLVNLASLALGWAMFGTFLLVPRLVQADPDQAGYGLAAGAFVTGLLLLPAAIGQTVGSPGAGVLARHVPQGLILSGGLALVLAASVVLLLAERSVVLVVIGTALIGTGAGAAIEASSAVATGAVPSDVAGTSTAVNSTVRRFSGGLGSQVGTIILGAGAAASASSAAPHSSFVVAFVVIAGLTLVGALTALLVPR